jgi:DNA-binding response OmpR family regulator
MKILIIEDDEAILSLLKRGLEEEGMIIDTAKDGEDGEYLAEINHYDIVILDWMLPQKSGIELLKDLREKGIKTPVLMLTAKDAIENKIEGLNEGADDYLTKPFNFDELLARLNAIYRRSVLKGNNKIVIDDIEVDFDSKIIRKNGEVVNLTAKEFELLEFLIANRGSVVSVDMIQDQLWNSDEFINSNVIQVIIYRLRNKLGKDLIKSKRNMGYFLSLIHI